MHKFRWLTVPVIAVALLSTACGGGDDAEDEEEPTETTTAAATATEGTSAATPTETSEGEGDAADLADIFAGFETATFNVTYQLESDNAEEAMSGAWTWIQDNEGQRTRFEADSEGDSVIMITTPEQTLLCSEGACFDASGAMGGTMPNIGDMFTESIDDVQAETTSGTVRRIDGREIAGTDTECVEFEDEAEGVSGVACYAEGGIPLFIESESSEGTFRMEATAFSTDVSDEDFEAPFPVTSLGG